MASSWNQPRYSPSSFPLKRKPETPSPKVISIPVHFVDSKNNRSNSGPNRSEAALKLQKVFRGFLLRKCVKKIVSIKNEVEGTERRIAKTETAESIRKDSQERLRITETLMALLLKLDSVRGIDSGVRDLRKRVIRKAIALQERVDALVTLPAGENEDGGEVLDDHVMQKQDEEMEEEETEETSKEGDKEKTVSEEGGEKKSNEEMQTQMIRMMSELVEKNEVQTRMINSLTQRVGQLEKALLCDKLRRSNKKNKRQPNASADGKQH